MNLTDIRIHRYPTFRHSINDSSKSNTMFPRLRRKNLAIDHEQIQFQYQCLQRFTLTRQPFEAKP